MSNPSEDDRNLPPSLLRMLDQLDRDKLLHGHRIFTDREDHHQRALVRAQTIIEAIEERLTRLDSTPAWTPPEDA